ncbi:MAG: alpha/beta hydrolase-fold protein [Planctomycetota bacterium]|jgi:hypothetical protein
MNPAAPLLLVLACLAGLLGAGPARGDTWVVERDPAVHGGPERGRVILFFVTREGRRWRRVSPMSAPFFSAPQPIASVAVDAWPADGGVVIDGSAPAYPGPLDTLDGPVRVQAVFDTDATERGHEQGPGNLYSDVVEVEVDAEADDDRVTLVLSRRVEPRERPAETPALRWVRLRSERLSAFYGRDVFHEAGIAFPPAYFDKIGGDRRWPTIYVIPGFGGRAGMAGMYARMLGSRGVDEIAPMAVHVVLDPESPLGHHGFVDSANHGPRGTALVTELMPYLEREFRLAAEPAGRIVTGHSSGGWSSLWLQLRWPDVFGACWSSAPDPVDFSAFQGCDLYRDESLYVDAGGATRPSMRRLGPQDRDLVTMTIEQECRMEHAIDPAGGSGQQWDSYEAMFSPGDAATGRPRPMFDAVTGRIDRDLVAEHWRRFDITRLVADDWDRHGPVVMERVRLVCGTLDSFYLNLAVARFKETVDRLAAEHGGGRGPGYVLLVEGATHGTVTAKTYQRWNREMREHLARHGYGFAAPGEPAP